jgi:hypothetical protein
MNHVALQRCGSSLLRSRGSLGDHRHKHQLSGGKEARLSSTLILRPILNIIGMRPHR